MATPAAASAFALSLMLAAAMPALAAPPVTLTDASFMDIQAQVREVNGFPNEHTACAA
ncbi:MAG: hypothetical protein H0W24_11135 [Lysobacter sp.]|nr:hypothetical protein [Lysobacter sp.]